MPKIDITTIPGLETAQALFGSISAGGSGPGDDIIAIMVFVYDTAPPDSFALI